MMKRVSIAVGFAFLALSALAASRFASGGNSPARPKITGIEYVKLYVSDMAKSKAFYSGALGLSNPGWNCACMAEQRFMVNAFQYVDLEAVPSPAPKNWVAQIGFTTDDVDAMARYLSAHGSAVDPNAIVMEGAKPPQFEVRDPEGNRIAFVQKSSAAPPFQASAKQISNRMLHAGFVVSDMAAANKFYSDILGFRVYWYGGFKDNDIDWYEIQVPDGGDWIEYMLNIPANADHKELGVQNHFSLGVKDAGVAAAQLKKQGLAKFDGPEVGRDGKNSLDAYDPDGTRVEVMEFTPRQTPCCHAYEAAHPSP
jgi:catechol 2,3-dioxygenase-like lactoylglutathione lyase family enzyme